jgi:hypothetical protein
MRNFISLLAGLFFVLIQSAMAAAGTDVGTVTIEVDAAKPGETVRDLVGVNRKPTFSSQTPGVNWNAASLYPAFGVSQVRLHDSGVDLCSTYTAAIKLNTGVTPAQTVTGCDLKGDGGIPHFTWTPASSADAELNNPNNYDFTAVDEALSGVVASGAGLYLRLGDSFNGPNDTGDPVAWAKIAANIYKHVLGVFKPTAGIAIEPAYVEIFNEPDGGFWQGQTSTFNTLFVETAQRVRAAASAAGKTVKVGGAGFTRNILASSTQPGNPANGFIPAVGASTLDFYSAHLYNTCSSATLASAADFLRALRTNVVNKQGGSAKPIHITEWNIGLGSQCGNAFFTDQRTQSFGSGILTLMQDPAQNVEVAHFYAAVPLMALFDTTSSSGTARINPSAWAFWMHSRLRGARMLDAQVCPQGAACVAGYAADSAPLLALAGQVVGGQNIVVTNDGSAAVTYTLRLKGLTSSSVTATVNTPPQGPQDLPARGNPVVADAAALAALTASVPRTTQVGLAVNGGRVDIPITIPAHAAQLVEVRPAANSLPAPSPYTGLWWNAAESGWGLSVAQHNNTIFAALYTYDASGQPTWYAMSSCPLVATSCTGEIYKVSGGSAPTVAWNGAAKIVSSAGLGTLNFTDAEHASFNFTLNGISGSRSIVRQVFASGATLPAVDYSDLWWNQNESGWGVALSQQYGVIFATWYAYDAGGKATWYVASACQISGTGCTGDLYQVAGGTAITSPWNGSGKVVTKVGSVSFSFTDQNNGLMNYTINGASASRYIARQSF